MNRRADEGSFLQNSTPTSRWRSPDTLRFLDSSTPRSIPRFFNRDANQSPVLTDIPAGCGDVTYEWHGGNEWLTLTPDNGVSTRASLDMDNLPNCGQLSLSVTARFGDKELTSSLTDVTVGTVDPNGLSLEVSAPEVVFLNDDERTNRFYHVTVTASCPYATNATVSLTRSGADGFAAFSDAEGETVIDPFTNVTFSVAADGHVTTHDFWFKCSQIGRGRLEARTTDGEGARQTVAKRNYTVIEPLQPLVTTARTMDGRRIYNPSRLVTGTNAWLCVMANGAFPATEIVWRVVSGPARIVRTNGVSALIEPTADAGEVVIEARFGTSTDIQPRFVLPIVKPRSLPIRVYYVKNEEGALPDGFEDFDSALIAANDIFAQIGVSFHQINEPQEIGNPSFAMLPNKDPHDPNQISDECFNLLNLRPQTNCISVVCVHDIISGYGVAAFAVPGMDSLVLGRDVTGYKLAHELGHLLGLDDIYGRRKANSGILMVGYENQAYADLFEDLSHDWGQESGRGFYSANDTHGILIESLLMCGFSDCEGCDIPSGRVRGYPEKPRHSFDKPFRKVGAGSVTR